MNHKWSRSVSQNNNNKYFYCKMCCVQHVVYGNTMQLVRLPYNIHDISLSYFPTEIRINTLIVIIICAIFSFYFSFIYSIKNDKTPLLMCRRIQWTLLSCWFLLISFKLAFKKCHQLFCNYVLRIEICNKNAATIL